MSRVNVPSVCVARASLAARDACLARAAAALFVLVAAAPGAGCTPPPLAGDDAGPGVQCEVDTNLDVDSADELTAGAQVDGFLCPTRDTDYYAFGVPDDRSIVVVHLWMDAAITAVEPGYTVLREDGSAVDDEVHDAVHSAGEPPDVTASHRIDVAGAYLLRVRDIEGLDNVLDVENPYHLQVDVIANPDDAEPNDDTATATATPPGDASGVLATTGDEDWFAVPVESPGQILDVRASAPAPADGSGLKLELELYAPDGITVIDTQSLLVDPLDDTQVIARIRAPASGTAGTTYYVRVHDDDDLDADVLEAVSGYALNVALIPDPDANEGAARNDTPATATTATSGTPISAAISTRDDQDVYRVTAAAGTTRANPSVLLVEVAFTGTLPPALAPQVLVLGLDPETVDADLDLCNATCDVCIPYGAGRCGEARLQRFVDVSGFKTAYAVRDTRPLFVTVNDVGDDAFQEADGYTITMTLIDDPDPGEDGDDFLIPNLENAGYANEGDLNDQIDESKPRARALGTGGIPPACPSDPDTGAPVDQGTDAGVAADCLPIVAVPTQSGAQRGYTVQCGGASGDFVAKGRISYEGDRDWFRIDLPYEGYWALDFSYDQSATSPVELTFFVHTVGDLIANDLVPEQVPGTPSPCGVEADQQCPADSVCVDGRCWSESGANPAFTGRVFPEASQGECAYVHVNDDRQDEDLRPLFIEVTDNGINDFDVEMEYTIRLSVGCGCPAACNGSFNSCQGVPPP